jgi:hypothetical protein
VIGIGIKGINKQNGVWSGITCTIWAQNRSRGPQHVIIRWIYLFQVHRKTRLWREWIQECCPVNFFYMSHLKQMWSQNIITVSHNMIQEPVLYRNNFFLIRCSAEGRVVWNRIIYVFCNICFVVSSSIPSVMSVCVCVDVFNLVLRLPAYAKYWWCIGYKHMTVILY